MIPYPSIDSLWVRSKETNRLVPGEIRYPVMQQIRGWLLTEKVDGTNLRVILGWEENGGPTLSVQGRTNKAQLPGDLLENVRREMVERDLHEYFGITEEVPRTVTLYGEGYGAGIQKGGGLYRPDKGFILFDVREGNAERGRWMDVLDVEQIASDLGLRRVPPLSVLENTDYAPQARPELLRLIPTSKLAQSPREAEGIVARPFHELADRFGNRMMWKLTFRDFPE